MKQSTKTVRKALRRNLKGSLLSPGQIDDLLIRSLPRKDYEGSLSGGDKDKQMLRALEEIFSGRNDSMLSQLREAFNDPSLTKQFYHNDKMRANVDGFLTEEVPTHEYLKSFQLAREILIDDLKIKRLTPAVLSEDTLFRLLKSNTSAGAVASGKKGQGDNPKTILTMANDIKQAIAQDAKDGVIFQGWIPAMMFHRGQLSHLVEDGKYSHDAKMKDRLVIGIDGATVAVEAQYAKPLANYLMEKWRSYAGGKTPDELRFAIRNDRRVTRFWYSIDYSGFDQRVPSWLIRSVFSIIKLFFDDSTWPELDWVCERFINTKILLPGGDVVTKHKGIASGSEFTQIVGSMCNELMILTYAASLILKRLGRSAPHELVKRETRTYFRGNSSITLRMHVMGDDNLFFTDEAFDLIEFASYVRSVFGSEVNPEKCSKGNSFTDSPDFLKRHWDHRNESRDLLEVCIGLVHPEYERKYDNYTPWHIIFGMYCTYMGTFERYVHPSELVTRLGDLNKLLSLGKGDRPGSFEAFGDKANIWLYSRAKTFWPPEMVRQTA